MHRAERNHGRPSARRALGRFIVADPAICHGKPTFRGTRVRVSDVLDMVASGMDWDEIVGEWRGTVPRAAIAEALRLAHEAFDARNRDRVLLPSGR